MIKPEDIVTREKDRDSQICNYFIDGELTIKEIAEKFSLTEQGVNYILRNNKQAMILDKEYEKLKRLAVYKRLLAKTPEKISSKRDTTDILNSMRIELEGEKGMFSEEKTVVNVYVPDRKNIDVKDVNRVEEIVEQVLENVEEKKEIE